MEHKQGKYDLTEADIHRFYETLGIVAERQPQPMLVPVSPQFLPVPQQTFSTRLSNNSNPLPSERVEGPIVYGGTRVSDRSGR